MHKAAMDLSSEINGRVLTEIEIIRGPNKWETIIQGMIENETKGFTFKLKDGQSFEVMSKICGVINNPNDIQKSGIKDLWGILLLVFDEGLFKELGINYTQNSATYVFFRGQYDTKVRSGKGELLIFNKPLAELVPIQSRFSLKI